MDKFEKLFAEYPCTLNDELVKKNTAEIFLKFWSLLITYILMFLKTAKN